MAYSELLADKVEKIVLEEPGFTMKKMFGGVCFLLRGNMACGVLNNDLIVRVGPADYDKCLALPQTKKFDITGKAMKGWVMVSFDDEKGLDDLQSWVKRGVAFALELPPKE